MSLIIPLTNLSGGGGSPHSKFVEFFLIMRASQEGYSNIYIQKELEIKDTEDLCKYQGEM